MTLLLNLLLIQNNTLPTFFLKSKSEQFNPLRPIYRFTSTPLSSIYLLTPHVPSQDMISICKFLVVCSTLNFVTLTYSSGFFILISQFRQTSDYILCEITNLHLSTSPLSFLLTLPHRSLPPSTFSWYSLILGSSVHSFYKVY